MSLIQQVASCLSALSLALSFCLTVYASPALADGPTSEIEAIPEVRQLWLPLVLDNGFFKVRPARPRDIEVTLDAARAVSSTVSEAGGVLLSQ
jgi:hypothetical protein